VLIYAGFAPRKKRTKCPEFDDLRVRAKLLFERLDPEKDTVIVPMVVLSEILVPLSEAERLAVVGKLLEIFTICPFDLPAAMIAADLVAQHNKLPADQQYNERQVMRADTMVVASAKASGATDFYCHDKKCRGLAALVMTAHDLPTGGETMLDTWLAADIRDGKQPPKPVVHKARKRKL
jgi:hypothetical protein